MELVRGEQWEGALCTKEEPKECREPVCPKEVTISVVFEAREVKHEGEGVGYQYSLDLIPDDEASHPFVVCGAMPEGMEDKHIQSAELSHYKYIIKLQLSKGLSLEVLDQRQFIVDALN